jgi:hypothetical protein
MATARRIGPGSGLSHVAERLKVSALAIDGLLVEIEAVAAIPAAS